MHLDQQFALSAGSVQGREHRRTGRNNQDAHASCTSHSALIAVVADGCSGGNHNEIGARLGARLLTSAIHNRLKAQPTPTIDGLLTAVREDVLSRLELLMKGMGGSPFTTVRDHFLFTLVGALVLNQETFVFSLGDGVFWLNGEAHMLRYEGNAPPYLGYSLIPEAVSDPALARAPFRIQARLPTAELQSLVLATDGAEDLDRAEPGWIQRVTSEDRYWLNPRILERQLTVLNREQMRIDRSSGQRRKFPGRLADDTTLVLLRRKRAVNENQPPGSTP